MSDLIRDFEELDDIKSFLSDKIYFIDESNKYGSCFTSCREIVDYLNNEWLKFQELNK